MKNRRFVVLGDLIADLYYNENKLIGIDGGSSRYNVVANLASMKCNTIAIGGCGDDGIGIRILKRYKDLGVDISNVVIKNKETRAYNLIIDKSMLPTITYKCSKNSPTNHKETWYDDTLQDIEYCRNKIKKDDIVILDELDEFSLEIIKNFHCSKVLDIGSSNRLKKLKDEDILMLKDKTSLLQLNERVIPYLMQRFECNNIVDIYKLLSPKLMIITKGKDGADFIYDNIYIKKSLTNCEKELDPTGAGDAFFSVFIKEYFNELENVNEEFIHRTFYKASRLTADVVKHIGARGHLYERNFDKTDFNDNNEFLR